MRIAVISEVSACGKNADIMEALKKSGHQVLNVGMTGSEGETELTYIHTGFMAGALLNLGAVDMVVGGCGTGQGFLNSAMQYPNVFCGLILDPLDAFLFSQINGGNCVSLALNKGYGWAGNLNLEYIFEKLFLAPPGAGYPPHRSESQGLSRRILKDVSTAAHKPFGEIIRSLDPEIVRTALSHDPFFELAAKFGHEHFDSFGEMKR